MFLTVGISLIVICLMGWIVEDSQPKLDAMHKQWLKEQGV